MIQLIYLTFTGNVGSLHKIFWLSCILSLVDEFAEIFESENSKMRFHLFILKNIVNNEINCNLFRISQDMKKEEVVEHFLDILVDITETSCL